MLDRGADVALGGPMTIILADGVLLLLRFGREDFSASWTGAAYLLEQMDGASEAHFHLVECMQGFFRLRAFGWDVVHDCERCGIESKRGLLDCLDDDSDRPFSAFLRNTYLREAP